MNPPKRRNFRAFLQILARCIDIHLRSPLQQIIENIGIVVASKSDGAFYVWMNLLNLALLLSANLGVMNLLPIPALDGGRLVFLVIEAIRGKRVSEDKEGMVHFIGLLCLFALMILIMFNDIRKLIP